MPETATAREVTITRVLDAPRELVWRAWTDPAELAQWWGPPGWSTRASQVGVEPRPGGAFRIVSVSDDDGSEMAVAGVYRELVEPERLVLEEPAEGAWHEGAVSEITLTDLGDGRTELLVRSTIHTTEDMARQAEAGMAGSIDRLAAHVATSGRSLVTGVDFAVVPTRDFEAATEFYGTVLGLPFSTRYGTMPGGEFETGTLTLAALEAEAFGMEFRPSAPIALRVDDVHAARAELEARGVEFQGEIVDSGVCHQTYFADPDGNPLILHHRYAPRA